MDLLKRFLRRFFGHLGCGVFIEDTDLHITRGDNIHVAIVHRFLFGAELVHSSSMGFSGRGPAELVQELKSQVSRSVEAAGRVHQTVGVVPPRVTLQRLVRLQETIPDPASARDEALPEAIKKFIPDSLGEKSVVADWQCLESEDHILLTSVLTRRSRVATSVQAFSMAGIKTVAHESAEFAALRASLLAAPPSGPDRLEVRFMGGPKETICWALLGSRPLLWLLGNDRGRDPHHGTCLSILRRIESKLLEVLPGKRIQRVTLQGFDDGLDTDEQLRGKTGYRCERIPGPSFTPATVAHGAALGALESGTRVHDLARHLQQQMPLHMLVNVGEILFIGCLIALMYFAYHVELSRLDSAHRSVVARIKDASWASKMNPAELAKEKEKAEARLSGFASFLRRDFLWSPHLAELAALVPPDTQLTSLLGEDPAEEPGHHQLTLAVVATRNLGQFMQDLRESALYRTHFEEITMESLGVSFLEGRLESAYQIICHASKNRKTPSQAKKGTRKDGKRA